MKKLVALLVMGLMFLAVACGPSAKELEAKRIADSTRVADSLVLVEKARIADSIVKAKADSIVADSIKKATHAKKFHLFKKHK
jgi:hypothetical protein